MVLGIDIDDTITETTITANRYLKDFTTLFQDYHELPKEEYHKFLNKYLTDIVKNNILKEGVLDIIAKNGNIESSVLRMIKVANIRHLIIGMI